MAQNYYEGMFLLDSAKFAADHEGVAGQIVGIIEKAGGAIQTHRPWQDGRLAYPIEGHRKGVHYLAYFTMEGSGLKDLNRACQLNDVVLRHMVIKQPLVLFDAMVAALRGDVEEPSDTKEAPAKVEAADSAAPSDAVVQE